MLNTFVLVSVTDANRPRRLFINLPLFELKVDILLVVFISICEYSIEIESMG